MQSSKKLLEDNAEYQRRRTMSQHEKDLGARDEIARRIHQQSLKDGKFKPFDEALKKATAIAEQVDKERKR